MQYKILSRFYRNFFIFILLFLTWMEVTKFASVTVSKIGGPIPILPNIQIELLKSENANFVSDALNETSKVLLNYLAPELSKEDWEAEYQFIDLISDNEPEIAFTLSLPPDRGILAIFQKKNNSYFLAACHNDLLPVSKLEVIRGKNTKDFLVTREDHKERLGAYCETRIVKVWHWEGNRLENVFSENSYWDINWMNTWQDPQSTPKKWYNLYQSLTVSYQWNEKGILLISTDGSQQYSEAPGEKAVLPSPHEFSLLNSRNLNQKYHWDNEWHYFILKTSTYTPHGSKHPTKIAILKDLENHLDFLAYPKNKMYQVMDQSGKILEIDKSSVN